MIETKEVSTYERDYIEDLTAFGYQKTNEVSRRSGRSTHHYMILARDTAIPNYDKLVSYEKEYEAAKHSIKYYEPASISTAFLLLLCFILPGVLYIVYKSLKKSDVKDNNSSCENIMKNAVINAKKLK